MSALSVALSAVVLMAGLLIASAIMAADARGSGGIASVSVHPDIARAGR